MLRSIVRTTKRKPQISRRTYKYSIAVYTRYISYQVRVDTKGVYASISELAVDKI